ncbi:MAG: MCE family protein [Aeromicrobium sp.]
MVVITVLAILVLGGGIIWHSQSKYQVTAHFGHTAGIYPGDNVTLLGVPIGRVSSIQPGARDVKVILELDSKQPVPANARAAIIAKSLVTVRAVAIGPAYQGGPRLKGGDVIPQTRTATPVEWDEVKQQVTSLARALGPQGTNRHGALSRLVSGTARNLDGEGATLNETLGDLSAAMTTLADNRGNIFATVKNLQVLADALNESDAQVRSFNTNLARVSAVLDHRRDDLSKALEGLRLAFAEVRTFLQQNGELTAATLGKLQKTSEMLAANRQNLADVLQVAPTAASNFYHIEDPRVGASTGALAFGNFNAPAQIICGALIAVGGDVSSCVTALGPFAKYLVLKLPGVGPDPSPGTATSQQRDTTPALLTDPPELLPKGVQDLLGRSDLLGLLRGVPK